MNFKDKLLKALNEEFPRSRVRRQAALNFAQHRILSESNEPQTGIFWWTPAQTGGPVLGWRLVVFYDAEFGETEHQGIWERWSNTILGKDAAKSPRAVAEAYCGLPRGRVTEAFSKQPRGAKPLWLILHGKDSPVRNASKLIACRFNLPDGKYKFEYDNHERMLRSDVAVIQQYLSRDLGLLKKSIKSAWY